MAYYKLVSPNHTAEDINFKSEQQRWTFVSSRVVEQEHHGHAYASATNISEPGAEQHPIGGISIFHLGITLQNASC